MPAAGASAWSQPVIPRATQLEAYPDELPVKLFLWMMLFLLLMALVFHVLASVWKSLRTPETFVIFMMFAFFVLVVGAILTYRAPA